MRPREETVPIDARPVELTAVEIVVLTFAQINMQLLIERRMHIQIEPEGGVATVCLRTYVLIDISIRQPLAAPVEVVALANRFPLLTHSGHYQSED